MIAQSQLPKETRLWPLHRLNADGTRNGVPLQRSTKEAIHICEHASHGCKQTDRISVKNPWSLDDRRGCILRLSV